VGRPGSRRLDKRRVLYVTQTLSGGLALALGVLVGTHEIRMWMVYVLAVDCAGHARSGDVAVAGGISGAGPD
jgi:hypothetical protein